jgi:hypothetical protein
MVVSVLRHTRMAGYGKICGHYYFRYSTSIGSYCSITFLRSRRKLEQGHLMSTMRGRF